MISVVVWTENECSLTLNCLCTVLTSDETAWRLIIKLLSYQSVKEKSETLR